MRIGRKVDQTVCQPKCSQVRGTIPRERFHFSRCLVVVDGFAGPVRGAITTSLMRLGQQAELGWRFAGRAAGQLIDGGSNEKLEPDQAADGVARQAKHDRLTVARFSDAKPNRLARLHFHFMKNLLDALLFQQSRNKIHHASRNGSRS